MSEYDHSHFFRKSNKHVEQGSNGTSSFDRYLQSLNERQLEELFVFYKNLCKPDHGQPISHPDNPDLHLTSIAYGRTRTNLFFALNAIPHQHPAADEHYLFTCSKNGQEMALEQFAVQSVHHVPSRHTNGLDKIVYAESLNSPKKRVGLELGYRIHWLTEKEDNEDDEQPYESIPAELFELTMPISHN